MAHQRPCMSYKVNIRFTMNISDRRQDVHDSLLSLFFLSLSLKSLLSTSSAHLIVLNLGHVSFCPSICFFGSSFSWNIPLCLSTFHLFIVVFILFTLCLCSEYNVLSPPFICLSPTLGVGGSQPGSTFVFGHRR